MNIVKNPNPDDLYEKNTDINNINDINPLIYTLIVPNNSLNILIGLGS